MKMILFASLFFATCFAINLSYAYVVRSVPKARPVVVSPRPAVRPVTRPVVRSQIDVRKAEAKQNLSENPAR